MNLESNESRDRPSEAASLAFWQGEFAHWFRAHAYPSIDGTADAEVYPFYEVRLARLLEIVADEQPGRLLDVGCGGGHVLTALLARGWTGVGCDFSQPMIAYARDRLQSEGWNPDLIRQDRATALEHADSSDFDLTLCLGPLEYMSHEEFLRSLAQLRRVTRPGGTVVTAHINGLFDLITLDSFTIGRLTNLFREAEVLSDADIARIEQAVRDRLGAGAKEGQKSVRRRIATRSDNPLAIADTMASAGLNLKRVIYYRFYGAPPFAERAMPHLFGSAIAAEKRLSSSWIGNFLASGFLAISGRA